MLAVFVIAGAVAPVAAQPADMVVTNARIVTLPAASHVAQAMAVRDGKILAIGDAGAISRMAGPATKRIDAGGRTVIPGLIVSHIHAVRAGLTFSTEVNWIGAKTIPEAMNRLRDAAAAEAAGCVARRRGRLDGAAVRRAAPTDAAGGAGRGAATTPSTFRCSTAMCW